MEKLKVLKKSFVAERKAKLKDKAKEYENNTFTVPEEAIIKSDEISVSYDFELNSAESYGRISVQEKLENAKKIYAALGNLTRSLAADERVWAYLTHVTCRDYMHELRGDSLNAKEIKIHWFFNLDNTPQRAIVDNDIAAYWWAADFTYDEDRENPYELTKEFLSDRDYTRSLLGGHQGRQKEFTKALMEFVIENKSLFQKNKEKKVRKLMRLANYAGGYKNFRSLSKKEIKEVLINLIRSSREKIFEEMDI